MAIRARSADIGLGSPWTLRRQGGQGAGAWLGILVLGNKMAKGVSRQERPSVAGGLISQANRPLARCFRWTLGGDLKGLSQDRNPLGRKNKNRTQLNGEWSAEMDLNGSATLSLADDKAAVLGELGWGQPADPATLRVQCSSPLWPVLRYFSTRKPEVSGVALVAGGARGVYLYTRWESCVDL